MKTDFLLKFKQNLFSKVIWSGTFKPKYVVHMTVTVHCDYSINYDKAKAVFKSFLTQLPSMISIQYQTEFAMRFSNSGHKLGISHV